MALACFATDRYREVVVPLSMPFQRRFHLAALKRLKCAAEEPDMFNSLWGHVREKAVRIQSLFRGKLARNSIQRWRAMYGRLELHTTDNRRLSVQCWRPDVLNLFMWAGNDQIPRLSLHDALRSRQCHTVVADDLKLQARRIQRAWRAHRVRRRMDDYRYTVQMERQEKKIKEDMAAVLKHLACNTIRNLLRGRRARKMFKKKKRMAIRIQCAWRGHRVRCTFVHTDDQPLPPTAAKRQTTAPAAPSAKKCRYA